MKKIMLIMLAAISMVACKKGDIQAPATATPTLTKKSSAKTTVMPKAKDTITYAVKVTGADAGTTSIMFDWDGSVPSASLGNFICEVIKDSDSSLVYRTNFPLVKNAALIFGGTPLKKDAAYTLRIIFTVNPAVRGTFALSVRMTADTKSTDYVRSGEITFADAISSTITVGYNPPTLSRYVFATGEEFTPSGYDLTSVGGASTLTEASVTVQGDQNVRNGLATVKLYAGTTMVGTASFNGGNTAIVTLNVPIPESIATTLTARVAVGDIRDLTSSATSSQTVEVALSQIKYIDAGGTAKTLAVGYGGNKFALLRARQIVTTVPIVGATIQNGVSKDLYKWKVESVGGSTANKQFAVQVTLTDNGPNADTVYCRNLYCKVNGVTVTARFTNASGQIIDSVGPGTTKVYMTFIAGTGEVVVPAGATTEFIFGGTFGGFNHPTNGDNASFILTTGPALSDQTFRYVNSGAAPNNLNAKVYASPSANASAALVDYLWSDLSATAHSFVFGAGSMDAKSDFGVTTAIAQQVWAQ